MFPHRRTWCRAAIVGIVASTALVAAARPAPAGGGALPPNDREELAAIFDPQLEELGLRTARAALQDLERYEESDTGTHLAVYVEPTGEPSEVDDAFYVDRIADTAKVFLPKVFRRWPGLKTFDVCIEPIEIQSATPPPVTQLQVAKDTARTVRWKRSDLARLVAIAAEHGGGTEETGNRDTFFLYLAPRLLDDPGYQDARGEAGLPPVTTTTLA